MCEHGNKFQELDCENSYAVALIEMGEGLKEISDIRVKLRSLNSKFSTWLWYLSRIFSEISLTESKCRNAENYSLNLKEANSKIIISTAPCKF